MSCSYSSGWYDIRIPFGGYMKRKVAVITTAFGYGLENREMFYKKAFSDHDIEAWYCTRDELIASPEGVDGIIVGVEKADETLFAACSDACVAMKFGVGMDNFDRASAEAHGITISNLPGINSDAVAEIALSLMLNVSRSISEMNLSCKKGEFTQICSHTIMGKTLGIVGLGSIGVKVAALARAFSMRCIGYDVIPRELDGIEQVGFETLLKEADIITIHVPLTEDNYHLFNKDVFAQMKKSAILINTARGGIVDEHDLAEALSSGRLSGAALDVYESKQSVGEVLKAPGSICTPHVAAYTHETLRHMETTIIAKMASLLEQEGC